MTKLVAKVGMTYMGDDCILIGHQTEKGHFGKVVEAEELDSVVKWLNDQLDKVFVVEVPKAT